MTEESSTFQLIRYLNYSQQNIELTRILSCRNLCRSGSLPGTSG